MQVLDGGWSYEVAIRISGSSVHGLRKLIVAPR